MQSYAARNRSRSLKSWLVKKKKNQKWVVNWCILKRGLSTTGVCTCSLIPFPSIGHHLLAPNLKLLSPEHFLLLNSHGIPICLIAPSHWCWLPIITVSFEGAHGQRDQTVFLSLTVLHLATSCQKAAAVASPMYFLSVKTTEDTL